MRPARFKTFHVSFNPQFVPCLAPFTASIRQFGERLRSKNETAQINEALTKVLCHNLGVVIQSIYELNVTPEFWSEAA
jgi:hypothetical protein